MGLVDEIILVRQGRMAEVRGRILHQIRMRNETHTLSQAADECALGRLARRQAKEFGLQPYCLIRLGFLVLWYSTERRQLRPKPCYLGCSLSGLCLVHTSRPSSELRLMCPSWVLVAAVHHFSDVAAMRGDLPSLLVL